MTPIEMIRANADLVVKGCRERVGISLTYDRNGVAWIDGHINRIRQHVSAEAKQGMMNRYGCFVGECMVRAYNGEWHEEQPGYWAVRITRRITVSTNVFGKIEKQLAGQEGDSILSAFDFALVLAERGIDPPANETGAVTS